MKKTIVVPPKEEHCIDGVYYRAGDVYEYEVEVKEKKSEPKGPVNGESTNKS